MNPQKLSVLQIPTDEIRFFVKRARTQAGFDRLKQSIKQTGLKIPIQVRDISKESASTRKAPSGGHYKYELICGQGRLQAFRDLRIDTIPAIVVAAPEAEIVGRFLAENVMRKRIPWLQKARLMKSDFDADIPIHKIAQRYSVSEPHVEKCLAIVKRMSVQACEEDIEALTIDEAYKLTMLPAKGQDIVLETMKEEGIDSSQIANVLNKAREVSEDVPLSKQALKDSLKRTSSELSKLRDSLKLKRLHWSLGPENLRSILDDKKIYAAIKESGINIEKFLTT